MERELWFRVLIFHTVTILIMLYSSAGNLDLTCSHQPIIALAGDDVILPCHLEPVTSAASWTVAWTKPGLDPEFVHVHEDGRLLHEIQNPSYYYRTRLFVDELEHGNVSMKIFKVKLSDEGTYRCSLPVVQEEVFVQLIVGSVSSPVVNMTSSTLGAVVLECESKGWYPEPEVLWLDGEGNLLSAGPTETVRGPDDLYTVSSRVTVEKRHSNSFTCRVQQNKTNQTTETQIHIQDDFFIFLSSSNVPIIIGLAVSLAVCIIVILSLVFFMWRKRLKTKRSRRNEIEEERQREKLMREIEELKKTNDLKTKRTTSQQNPLLSLVQGGVQRKEEPEEEVERLRKQLENKETEFKDEENQRLKTDLQNLESKSAGRVSESQSSQVKSSSSVSQSSTIIVDEIDPEGKYIRLRNLSSEDQPLGGWSIYVKVDDRKPIIYTFDFLRLGAGQTVTIWAAGCGHYIDTLIDLVWAGQPSWGTGNQTVVTLFNDSRQEVTRRTVTARH